jgi:hypothetical protein
MYLVNSNGPGNGWKQAQWTILVAVILAAVTGAITFWQRFTVMAERMEYLLKLNEAQSQLIDTLKGSTMSLQQQTAILAKEDLHHEAELKEHEDFLRSFGERLRKVEQRKEGQP